MTTLDTDADASLLLDQVQQFANNSIRRYLEDGQNERRYPVELIEEMRALGLFGTNVSPEFGGLGLPPTMGPKIVRIIGSRSQSLAALLGTHWRVNLYFIQEGTHAQQKHFLPGLANGSIQAAHAYHEARNNALDAFQCLITDESGRLVLSGVKSWVTNAANADRMVVIARHSGSARLSAVIVDPTRREVIVGQDHERAGLLGVSLAPVQFNEYEITFDDCIGGEDPDITEFIHRFEPGSSLGFAARAVGAADAVLEELQHELTTAISRYPAEAAGVIRYRLAQAAATHGAMEATLSAALSAGPPAPSAAHLAKVFCSDALVGLCQDAAMLSGGSSFAGGTGAVSRALREATALRLIDTPNDVLLSRVGAALLP